MIVTGIKFKKSTKVYFFDNTGIVVKDEDDVIVETAHGIEVGKVVFAQKEVDEKDIVKPLKKILRVMRKEDYITLDENCKLAEKAMKRCEEKIAEHGLGMKLISCNYTFDRAKLLFYFTADGRVDFRELVKDLAGEFRTRIELRQIGVRDEIKMMGTLGMCGRTSCCHSYLSNFQPVSIKMAKNQNLSLNPTKISGMCGRLMCCLGYEDDTYKELNKRLPKLGDKVKILESGKIGEVIHINVIRQVIKIVVRGQDDVEILNKKIDEIKLFKSRENIKKENNKKDFNKEEQSKNKNNNIKNSNKNTNKNKNGKKNKKREN